MKELLAIAGLCMALVCPAGLCAAGDGPSPREAQALIADMTYQRAAQTYLWALPLISTAGMKYASESRFGAGYHVLPIWKRRLDARTKITTPNSDVIYAMGYLDLGVDGPIVIDAPPKLQGILLDAWQRPIAGPPGFAGDVGFYGPDAGQGGKFLLLPLGYAGDVPPGFHVFRPATNNVFVFLRGFYQDPTNLAPPVALMERTRIYPLHHEADARPMRFPDASGVPIDMLPRHDLSAFEQLHQLIDSETTAIADPDWLGMLASLGIVKGQSFAPDKTTRRALAKGAQDGFRMSRALAFQHGADGVDYRVFDDRQWLNPFASGMPFDFDWRRNPGDHRALDARAWYFTNYFSLSPAMVSKIPSRGAAYMIAFHDAGGRLLQGQRTYTLTLPGPIPVANFWSVTLYDARTGSGLDNGQAFPSLGSRDALVTSSDGTTVLQLSPRAPAGSGSNWLRTIPDRGYFVVLRLYGPLEAALDRRWKPGDVIAR